MSNPSNHARLLSSSPGPARRRMVRALAVSAAAALVAMSGAPAMAAPGDVATDSVTANVNVSSIITLALDQSSFDLNGAPSSTVSKTGAVTGTVTTNNAAGYSVGVVAAADTLQPTLGGNADSIPIANLEVHNAAGVYTALSEDPIAPVITTTTTARSALTGDAFSDDYQVAIPDVNSDTYSVVLDYTATALA